MVSIPTQLEDLPELFGLDDSSLRQASLAAISRLQAKGIDIFYFDTDLSVHIMEKPNGQRFEISYTGEPNAAFEVIRELGLNA
jgi:hypothetical protein